VADHSEYIYYRRATGLTFAGIVFALKAGLGLGGAIAGTILSSFGYVANATMQSESAITGIKMSASIIPAITFLVGVLALSFYPITKKFNEQMQKELTLRREREKVE